MILNFTCLEKKQALLDKSCNQTIRMNIEKFLGGNTGVNPFGPDFVSLERYASNLFRTTLKNRNVIDEADNESALLSLRPLHIWWNARNFHVEDICECGHTESWHREHCCTSGSRFKLKRKGLGKSQFLGMGEITSIVKKKVSEITEEDAIADGFKSDGLFPPSLRARDKLKYWLLSHNKNLKLSEDLYIIRWKWL